MLRHPEPPNDLPGTLDERDQELVDACLDALRELAGTEVREGRTAGPYEDERLLELRLDGQEARFALHVKRGLRPEHVGPLAHQARQLADRGDRLLVCAERVPDQLGKDLRDHGVAYIDRGGNAWLRGPGLNVLIMGRPPVGGHVQRRSLRGTEVRLLGVFLTDPEAGGRVQTDLAERAGIALGAVGTARETLTRLGILEQTGERLWRVRDRTEGLRRFGDGWADVVRHRLRPRKYRLMDTGYQGGLEPRLARAGEEYRCLLGGELAAAHLTGLLQTEHATLHIPKRPRRDVVDALTLVPDARGPITLLERYGKGDDYQHPGLPGVPFAHPLLVWAECLMVPDERVAPAVARLHEGLLQEPT